MVMGGRVSGLTVYRGFKVTVSLHVLVSVVGTEEHLFTERALECAMVFSSVSLVMTVKVLLASEGFATLSAGVWLFTGVSHFMPSQMVTGDEV